jgi:hypothetical protein
MRAALLMVLMATALSASARPSAGRRKNKKIKYFGIGFLIYSSF